MRDGTKGPCTLSHVAPFYRWGDRGTATDSAGRRLLFPSWSWGPLCPRDGTHCQVEMSPRKPWQREGWGGRGVSLRPTGPGEGCTSRAWEGTWVWALGTTSRLDVSPCRPQGLGTRPENPPSPATLLQPAAAAHPSRLHKRRMPGLKEGRSLSRCTPRPLTCRGQAQPQSLAKWPSPGPRAPFSLALPTLFISGLHFPPRPRPRLGILSPTPYPIARMASASAYTLLATHSVSTPVPAPLCASLGLSPLWGAGCRAHTRQDPPSRGQGGWVPQGEDG